jgi:hypothetical protein
MRTTSTTLAAILFAPVAALFAADPVGVDAVWNPPPDFTTRFRAACGGARADQFGECFVGQMRAAGAPPPAIAFASATGNQGYLAELRETGRVDVARAVYPFRANENDVVFLVNGTPAMIDVDAPKYAGPAAVARSAEFREIQRRVPKAAVFPGDRFHLSSVTVLERPGGGQSFLVESEIHDGCHACAVVGTVSIGFDFDGQGRLLGSSVVSVRAAPEDPGRGSR